jgi:predicted nucleic acid-binding protein
MTAFVAVADANAIIGLAKGGVFHLLAKRYSVVYVPPSVTEEVTIKGTGRPGAIELSQVLGSWVREVVPGLAASRSYSSGLSTADRDVLGIAQERGADHILSSDEGLYREAMRLGLTCLSTLEVIVQLKRDGLINNVRTVLDAMLGAKHGIEPAAYEQVLRTAGEWPTS